ncbi:MFS transporter [Pseudomonas sp. C2L12B]|uniref:MFS transporter n=2 Tax=Pseudomonas typographi TaxID=2715964 RepID=A0ABR7YW99_9PSED|nr:MFS transporter [Pseudomonas typographi]MBD1585676.1 MFS transporter [Pseudomonas typographi]MBD1597411.1 MFS transporter [Pseudomonas typographi]
MAALLALTMTSFIATANETVPAGLLPEIAQGFGISEAWAGQLVTACALGSGVAAIPLTAAVRSWPRRRVLLLALVVFFVCNAVTAVSPCYKLTLVARFTVGLATGLAWSLLATYARCMVVASLQGRALAVAMIGIPLALSLGVPLSAWLGALISWRCVFGFMAGLTLMLMIWVFGAVPDYPGQAGDQHLRMREVLKTPGVRSVLFVVMAWILAHYILFTYIAPFLSSVGLADHVGVLLLIFGICAMIGIWIVGVLIERWLRALVLIGLGTFASVALVFGICGAPANVLLVYLGVAAWGLSFGGAPTLLQTALADAAGNGADVAQAMLVTVFNLAFAGSGVIGGVLLVTAGVASFPWVLLALLLVGLLAAWQAKTQGFIPGRRRLMH